MNETITFTVKIEGGESADSRPLPLGVTKIGRVEGNDIVLAHGFVSSRHAQLDVTATTCLFTDLKSTNGSLVNGQAATPHTPIPVRTDTKIQIGPFTLTFTLTAQRAAPPAPPPEPVVAPLPPTPPPPTPPTLFEQEEDGDGISADHYPFSGETFLPYLPAIYQTEFMGRFLAIFESIYAPLEWTVDQFDLFLHARTAPAGFLPWLGSWFAITFDRSWTVAMRREILCEAHHLYAMRGTKWALSRIIEIYTGERPKISEFTDPDNPYLFLVQMPVTVRELNPELVIRLIDTHKPTHTTYKLQYERGNS